MMKKIFLLASMAVFTGFAMAQELDDIRNLAILNQNAKAKDAVDKYLAIEKNAKKPDGWFSSLYVNVQNALSSLGDTRRGQFLEPKKVRLMKLDSYAAASGIPAIDFLKIDVEGFEGHVLRGAEALLSASPNLIVLSQLAQKNFEPLGFSVSEVLRWMRRHGFEVYMVEDQSPKLQLVTVDLEKYPYQNFLFIRSAHPKHSLLDPYLKP